LRVEAGEAASAQPSGPGEPGMAWRIGAVLLGLVAAIVGAILIAVMLDVGEDPTCDEAAREVLSITNPEREIECFDGSSTAKTLTLILGLGSAIAFIALLPLGIYYAAAGRGRGLLLLVLGAAIGLGLLLVLVTVIRP
jgi:hypothetical protein